MEPNRNTRHTPSRAADAELGKRAHMLIWGGNTTQGKVAQKLGMSSDSLGRKLKGERGWALAEVIAIASILNTTVAYLMGETENPRPGDPDGGSEHVASTVKSRRFIAPVTPLFPIAV